MNLKFLNNGQKTVLQSGWNRLNNDFDSDLNYLNYFLPIQQKKNYFHFPGMFEGAESDVDSGPLVKRPSNKTYRHAKFSSGNPGCKTTQVKLKMHATLLANFFLQTV